MSEPPRDDPRRKTPVRFSAAEWVLLAYAVFGGAAWVLVFFDGTMGGFVDGLIAFLVVGLVLAVVVSRFENTAHERRRFVDDAEPSPSGDHALRDRDKPPTKVSLLWGRRAALAMCVVGLVSLVMHRDALQRLRKASSAGEAFLGVMLIVIGVVVILLIDRKVLAASDAWLAERRAARAPEPSQPAAIRPLHVHEHEGEALHHRRPEGRERLQRTLEKTLIVFGVLGLPICMWLFDFGGGFVAYGAIIMLWLAAINRVEGWSASGLRVPSASSEQRRVHERIHKSRSWLSAHPPSALKHMRAVFLCLVVIGGITCIVMPFLRGDSPADRYQPTVLFVAGFLLGLTLLGIAEHEQRRRELEWLEDRRSERERERKATL